MLAAPTLCITPSFGPQSRRAIRCGCRSVRAMERRVIFDTYRRSDNSASMVPGRWIMDRKLVALTLLASLFATPVIAREYHGWVYDGLTGVGGISESGLSDDAFASNSNLGYRWGTVGVEVGHVYFGKF